ncbi:MAG: L-2-hydroxyglutarate oxidase [Chloroflexi bacterium]|nr:L-2-hydroxyglutarate oxidase [Chloroflexota bacterium]
MSSQAFDVAIVGGGIVGLATALALVERRPSLRLTLLEKEQAVASHQTGHNSGVIHSGIYYKPGSLKARLCVAGARQMRAFCDAHGIRYETCGKVIVATHPDELPRLNILHERAQANGVPGVTQIGPERLRELEPEAAGLCALHSPHTAIVDYREVAAALRREIEQHGAVIKTGARVTGIAQNAATLHVETTQGDIAARFLINCAGLYSDTVARMMGLAAEVRIVPFRGEYYMLKPERASLVNGLIYPVPDPRFPFLGVHFTRTVHGELEAGPNAVLAFAREGYTMGQVNAVELAGTLGYVGFWRMAMKYWRTGLGEFYRSFSKAAFVRSLQRLVPAITEADAERGGAGVRAQAINPKGDLVDDFSWARTANSLHVLNAVSPAATASLAIGEYIAAQASV